MTVKPKLALVPRDNLEDELNLDPRQNLELLVNKEAREHWNQKIMEGIIPAEVKAEAQRKGVSVDKEKLRTEYQKLAMFEGLMVEVLFRDYKKTEKGSPPSELHYFGVGSGHALEFVTPIANKANHVVIAYDTSDEGYNNALRVFDRTGTLPNTAYLADIEDACGVEYIEPDKAGVLVASRVLDILDKQEESWQDKHPKNCKAMRVAKKIGAHPLLDIVLIHRCPEDNPQALWEDATPHSLKKILWYMRKGARKPLVMDELGRTNFFDQLHKAVWIHATR